MALSVESNNVSVTEKVANVRNVTFAVNYEVAMVDQFLATKRRGEATTPVGGVPPSTEVSLDDKDSYNLENKAPDNYANDNDENKSGSKKGVTLAVTPTKSNRRSVREKKRDVALSRIRVRYDMQVVPPARRNQAFLNMFPLWWMNDEKPVKQLSHSLPVSQEVSLPSPFQDNSSVVWIPSKRAEWEDSVSEMTAVCTSAALRRFHLSQRNPKSIPFHAPLSREYIRDRVDIDDPLYGYQIRHKTGGWLQGFILWTNFTTWTHGFKWDSLHPLSGVTTGSPQSAKIDIDGSLSQELEGLSRSGDPSEGGIVFNSIAEIALLGGLACGEYLLRMALDEILEKKLYKYVVMQATEQSRMFYERFGFIRVGVVCRYGPQSDGTHQPYMGYRHWTHANESESSLQLHGGPSYMMCLKLPSIKVSKVSLNSVREKKVSFFDQMMSLRVVAKPTIEQIGGLTPGPKHGRRINTTLSEIEEFTGALKKAKRRTLITHKRKSFAANRKSGDSLTPKRQRLKATSFDSSDVSNTHETNPLTPTCSPSPVQTPSCESSTTTENMSCLVSVSEKSDIPEQINSSFSTNKTDSDLTNLIEEQNIYEKGSQIEPNGIAPSVVASHRPFYAVRGIDGRFATTPRTSSSASDKPKPLTDIAIPADFVTPSKMVLGRSDGQPVSIVKSELLKQKVRSYPRSRVHYFNRVVKPSCGVAQYYFVLHYNETAGTIRLAPMVARGRLTGKRDGRPRYQVAFEETDTNFKTADVSDYQVVHATMVMKTPVIANEAWDIED